MTDSGVKGESRHPFVKRWDSLALLGTWLCSLFGPILVKPAAGAYDVYDNALVEFGRFLVTVVVGLFILLTRHYTTEEYQNKWSLAAASTFVVVIFVVVFYNRLSESYTVDYNGAQVVIGPPESYTSQANVYIQSNPGITDEEMLFDAAGDVVAIWDRNSVGLRRLRLALLYMLSLPLLSVSVMALIQAFSCGTTAAKRSMPASKESSNSDPLATTTSSIP